MIKVRQPVLLAVLLVVASVTEAQQVRSSALKQLAFLSGRWVSENGPEVQEENWSPVSGDSMVGSFRIVQDGKPVFYEFWAIELDKNRPVLKLKHFNANLVGWEEKTISINM